MSVSFQLRRFGVHSIFFSLCRCPLLIAAGGPHNGSEVFNRSHFWKFWVTHFVPSTTVPHQSLERTNSTLWVFLSGDLSPLYYVVITLLRRVEGATFGEMLFKYISTNMRKQNSKTFSSLEDNFWGTSTKGERRLNTAMTSELFF